MPKLKNQKCDIFSDFQPMYIFFLPWQYQWCVHVSSKYLDHWARNCLMCIWQHYIESMRRNLPTGIRCDVGMLVGRLKTTTGFQWLWRCGQEDVQWLESWRVEKHLLGCNFDYWPPPSHCDFRHFFGSVMNWRSLIQSTCLASIAHFPMEYPSLKHKNIFFYSILLLFALFSNVNLVD